jgi:hypothetical protein
LYLKGPFNKIVKALFDTVGLVPDLIIGLFLFQVNAETSSIDIVCRSYRYILEMFSTALIYFSLNPLNFFSLVVKHIANYSPIAECRNVGKLCRNFIIYLKQ